MARIEPNRGAQKKSFIVCFFFSLWYTFALSAHTLMRFVRYIPRKLREGECLIKKVYNANFEVVLLVVNRNSVFQLCWAQPTHTHTHTHDCFLWKNFTHLGVPLRSHGFFFFLCSVWHFGFCFSYFFGIHISQLK